eukprot:jgi/Mesen1/4174/ME000219S03304
MDQEEAPQDGQVEQQPPPVADPDGGTVVGITSPDGKYVTYQFYGIRFEISSRYGTPIVPIGRGAFGIVCSARDLATGGEVAIKKIGNAFVDKTDAKRTLREILLLRHMDHPNYIHSAHVLHRDLKPPNILIDGRCNVKITDFGLSRTMLGEEDHMTEYVVTRYYRAPELLLNSQDYTAAIDVWSVGCIYMELVTGHILLPGRDYVDQLQKTTELIGTPTASDLSFLKSDDARRYILSLPPRPPRSFAELFPQLSATGADLVQRMLVFDPAKRISVTDALAHPYLAQYHEPADEPVHPRPLQYDLSFEQEDYSIQRIRQLIYEQACAFNPL